ncbi:MAG: glycosyltransferase family 2 protein [Candidatus Omnitrophota bacterium]
MTENTFKTPVLFLVFNRPSTARRVWEAIRRARPERLFIAADGPRLNKSEDLAKCREVKDIVSLVDWPCEVKLLYREENLGCKLAISSAIDWFFSQVEEGIILEDDCLPDATFFPYCQQMLARYRDDQRIMAVSGINLQFGRKRGDASYYFSKHIHVWGWASWRRAWKHYDVTIKAWPQFRDGGYLKDLWHDDKKVQYWTRIYDFVYGGEIDTWDYQWEFAMWQQGALNVMPSVNLVSNIGFGSDSTHTDDTHEVADLKLEPMIFPVKHPVFIIRDKEADDFTDSLVYTTGKPSLRVRALRKLKRLKKKLRI